MEVPRVLHEPLTKGWAMHAQVTTMGWSVTFSQTSWSVTWALGSMTTNKAGGSDGIPTELFQILDDDAVKVLHSYAGKFGKPTVATGLE